MSFAWKSTACQDVCCVESSCTARETKAVQKSSTKTLWKQISRGASSNPKNWRSAPVIDHVGESQFMMLLSPLRMLDAARDQCHKASSAVITTTDFQCLHGSRLCTSSLGLLSHLQVHRWDAETIRHLQIQRTIDVYKCIYVMIYKKSFILRTI